jgi:hypothetical protein
MGDTAVHLTAHVLPETPIRQWVCSLPWGLRALCGYDRELCAKVLGAFVEELMRSYRFRAKRCLGLASVEDVHPGAILFVQRFDSALRLNVHAHVLAIDGVYVRGDDPSATPAFHVLAEPTQEEILDVARRTALLVVSILKKHGRSIDGLAEDGSSGVDDDALASCYGAAARTPAVRILDREGGRTKELTAVVMGFDVHAGAAIDGRDRKRVERVCRYLARPPIAQERLEQLADGTIRYELKKAWRDGTRFVVFQPHDFLARLCAMVPPPWFHMTRFFGVLAPNSKDRKHVVSSARHAPGAPIPAPPPIVTLQVSLLEDLGERDDDATRGSRKPWSWLLHHVFSIDVTVCPRCSGSMRWVEVATTPEAIAAGLSRAGLGPRAPPTKRRTPLGQLELGLPS